MLELSRSEAFRVDVGELLEFECTLKCHRVAHVATQVQNGAGICHPPGKLFDPRTGLHHLLQLSRKGVEVSRQGLGLLCPKNASGLAEIHSQKIGGHHLRKEGLGRGDSDLGSRVRVESRVRFARNRGALSVTDGECLSAALRRIPNRHQGVHGFARLTHRNHESLGTDCGFAVTKFMRKLYRNRNPRPLLDRIRAEHGGIGRRSTRNEDNSGQRGITVNERAQFRESHHTISSNPAPQSVGDGFGFLGNFFSHEA